MANGNHMISRYAAAFAAGFIAVLVFHQGMLSLLNGVGFVAAPIFPTQPTYPLGIPAIWSLAFWGGIWGVLLALAVRYFPDGVRYWVGALLFGAIFPSLVAWFIVFPLKGAPVAAGGDTARLITALLINGAWGFGTALLLYVFTRGNGVRNVFHR